MILCHWPAVPPSSGAARGRGLCGSCESVPARSLLRTAPARHHQDMPTF